MNDNERPAEFDLKLMAYMPGIRSLAVRWEVSGQREDLIQDTIAYVLTHWKNFRHDGDYKNFYSWIKWQMRGIANNRKRRIKTPLTDDPTGLIMANVPVPANQEYAADLVIALDKLATNINGSTLLRFAAGFDQYEIAASDGVSRQAVSLRCRCALRDLEGKERKRRHYRRKVA